MSANYEWQKHQANERIKNRIEEAESHQQANLRAARRKSALKGPIVHLLRLIRAARPATRKDRVLNPAQKRRMAD
ncbi:MAG: hypothetical protein R3335_10715 [Anaerolineales bacterium]|nr:hypothetical protein [Anaerolineales bacterium]